MDSLISSFEQDIKTVKKAINKKNLFINILSLYLLKQ